MSAIDPLKLIKRASTTITAAEVYPRLKEGGAFVKFTYPTETTSAEDVERSVKSSPRETQMRPWWNPFRRMRARLVRGRPWLEDLRRLPSARLKVEFTSPAPGAAEPAELSQEQLYALFRPYGRLTEITTMPADSKVLPKYALLDFIGPRRAIMAKNCMHGFVVGAASGGGNGGTLLRLTYTPKVKVKWLRDWLFNHPRIVIPALAAIIATITVAVFDP